MTIQNLLIQHAMTRPSTFNLHISNDQGTVSADSPTSPTSTLNGLYWLIQDLMITARNAIQNQFQTQRSLRVRLHYLDPNRTGLARPITHWNASHSFIVEYIETRLSPEEGLVVVLRRADNHHVFTIKDFQADGTGLVLDEKLARLILEAYPDRSMLRDYGILQEIEVTQE